MVSPYTLISQNRLKTYLLLFGFIVFFSGVFYILGVIFNSRLSFFITGFVFSLLGSFSSYWWSDKIVLKLTGAKPANKKEHFDFYTAAENLSLAAGLPMPKLYVIEDDAPNAFATGRSPKNAAVAATTGLLKRLNRSEIEGVVAHELAHIKNYDVLLSTVVAVLVGTLGMVVDMALNSVWFMGSNDDRRESGIRILFFILFSALAYFIGMIIQFAISRRRELLADATGVMITRNPQGLISALKKISAYPKQVETSPSLAHLYFFNPLDKKRIGKFMANLFSTHPPVEERIKALEKLMK